MSDKSRNMNDINDQKTAEQQAFSEEIRRRLAEPDSGKPTLDEFKVMVYKDREKRRKKRNTLVACLVAAFIVGYLTYDDLVPKVGADKNPKETIQTEDGVIIEDGGWGSSEEADNVWVTEDWEQVADAKELYPEMLVPTYIPNGYSFELLKIEKVVDDNKTYKYTFNGESREVLEIQILVIKSGAYATRVYDSNIIIASKAGPIYLNEKEKTATIQINDGSIINIWGLTSHEEITNIVESISD